jgi:hypothetical protein
MTAYAGSVTVTVVGASVRGERYLFMNSASSKLLNGYSFVIQKGRLGSNGGGRPRRTGRWPHHAVATTDRVDGDAAREGARHSTVKVESLFNFGYSCSPFSR